MFDFSFEPIEQGYTFESTILVYGLNEQELGVLNECIKIKQHVIQKGGILSKDKVDQICYPDVISKRMFYRDIQILRDIEEGHLQYDRKKKGYVIR